MKRLFLIFQSIALLFVIACGQADTPRVATGSVHDGKYTNTTIPLEFSIPRDWHVFTPDENRNLKEVGVADAASRVDAPKGSLQKAVSRVTQPVTVSRHVPPSSSEGNSSFACYLENVEGRKQKIIDGHAYLDALLHSLRTVKSPLTPITAIQTTVISGHEFSVVTLEMRVGPQRMVQRYYARYHKGSILAFIVTGADVDGDTDLGSIIGTIKIDA